MIVSKLSGGLGNQMFQYALGRCLATKNKTKLFLDVSSYEVNDQVTHRNFALQDFFIEAEILKNPISIGSIGKPGLMHRLSEKFIPNYPYYKKQIILERGFNFDSNILKAPKNCTLIGYWQSEEYFKDIAIEIRTEFDFKPAVKTPLNAYGRNIDKSNSVSVHFRRGDYIKDIETNQIHGLCELDYYQRGIDLLSQRFSDLELFVFSDDIDWVKSNFKTTHKTYFIENNESPIADLYLMSLCKHHIIANSSFSWWGAWLCKYPEKVIVAPKKWFNLSTRNTNDILPSSWIRL